MLNQSQYKKIISLNKQGNSVRSIRRSTGHSRNTINKVLAIKTPPLFIASSRPSIIDEYKDEINKKYDIGRYTTQQIYDELIKNNYAGSFSTLRKYLSKLAKEKSKIYKRHIRSITIRREQHKEWLFSILQGKTSYDILKTTFANHLDPESFQELYKYLLKGTLRYRNRSLTIFAYLNKLPQKFISETLGIHKGSVRRYIAKFESGGTKQLFDFSRKNIKKFQEPKYRDKVFQIFHSPPSCYGYNRTTWRMEDLHQTMSKEGCSLAKAGIREIIKKEGYRLAKARKVLTSNDPLYREKLKEITNILSNLKTTEKFFSIDEFGPFAIKMQGGKSWVLKEENRIVPQWQKSKGSLILTQLSDLRKT